MEFDVVVIGSGAAALTAAVTAALEGLEVLVVEKADKIGGTSALSGGVAWVPNNPRLDEISRTSGEHDSRERAMRYFESLVGPDRMRPDLMEAFYENGRKMVEYLESKTVVRFDGTTYPDYKSHLDGGIPIGRSISASTYHGSDLGKWFARLQPPMKEMCVMGSMMMDGTDLQHFLRVTKSPRSFLYAARRVLTHGFDLIRYGRGARLVMGNALIGRLLKAALDAKVTIWTSSPAEGLVMRNGRVVAINVRKAGKPVEVSVRRGVILGAGGFPHDKKLKQELIPHPDQHETLCPETNTGDGIHMGMDVGGHMGGNTWHNFLGTQVAMMHDAKGKLLSKIPFRRLDRNKPGYILVDRRGRRFVNEAWPYNDVTHAMNQNPDAVPSFLICDHTRIRRYGIGLIRPGPAWARPLGRFLRLGHLYRGATLAELASQLGIEYAGLSETVTKMNHYARTGIDEEFHKGETTYDRWQGDPEVKPNPSLGPIEQGPFYAIKLWPGNLGTFCGLETDARARVLNDAGEAIAGLYAVGTDMHPVFSGSYPGGGGSIGPGMTFGFIAGLDIVGNSRSAT